MDIKEKEYNIDMSVYGYWTWTGKAASAEEAMKKAIDACSEVDFGELKHVDYDVYEVY